MKRKHEGDEENQPPLKVARIDDGLRVKLVKTSAGYRRVPLSSRHPLTKPTSSVLERLLRSSTSSDAQPPTSAVQPPTSAVAIFSNYVRN